MSADRDAAASPHTASPTAPRSSGSLVRRRHLLHGALALGALGATGALLAACGTSSETPTLPASPAANDAMGHVHAAAFTPDGTGILLATHDGLYTLAYDPDGSHGTVEPTPAGTRAASTGARTGTGISRVGARIDLMGFTIAPDGTYLSSGHPGSGASLPQPLGLARSADRGRTWQVLSRGGESDFHALAASPRGVLGYDGTLRFSRDLRTWQTRSIPAPPRMLSADRGTGHVLATTEAGLLLSVDDGQSWSTLSPPALVSDAAWSDANTIVAITTGQVLALSRDRGATWTSGPGPVAAPAGAERLEPVAALACRPAAGRPSSASAQPRTTLTPGSADPPEVLLVFGHLPVVTRDLGATSVLVH